LIKKWMGIKNSAGGGGRETIYFFLRKGDNGGEISVFRPGNKIRTCEGRRVLHTGGAVRGRGRDCFATVEKKT